ncbi:SIR2 family protein [Pseudomonas sichuanensis]|uniref:SIR2 family protein n=1 Tax=Pseudomonas sichuanensis TaxID=2213015 RepID=UPI002B40E951|nr:SIR2 family protein [Pseudomonas sichuanensis]
MPVTNPNPTFHSYDVLLERVAHSSREIIFFFGSALSLPESEGAPGVPSVADILSLVEETLTDTPSAFSPVRDQPDVGAAYQKAFQQLQAYQGQDAANEVIRRAVFKARKVTPSQANTQGTLNFNVCRALDEDFSGWHLRPSLIALGKLLAKHSGKLGKTVLTTNFDPLIQTAIRTAHGTYIRTMMHDDGALNQSEGPGIQIVHLHGYWYGTDTLHVPTQIGSRRDKLKRSLERLLQNRTLVVMGCGGWDDIFMSSLSDLVSDTELNPDVLWTFYESDEGAIRGKYAHVFTKLAPAINRGRAQFYAGVDLHVFLPQLLERLKDGTASDEQTHINDILERLGELSPELRHSILGKIDPSLILRVDDLKLKHDTLEKELVETRDKSAERATALEEQAARLAAELQQAQAALTSSRLALTSAAMKDISWLTMVRTQMMPKQPGRVPFHNSKEVALRGYHASAGAQRVVPALTEVTWSPVAYQENNLHRGYYAALIFKGDNFVPGVVWTYRRNDEGLHSGNSDYFWSLPSIYFGDYLEVSTGDGAPEAPLSWRGYEFQVKNPEGQVSEWVKFSYPFNDTMLESLRIEFFRVGVELLESGKASEAVEPLRKSYVYTDRMLGIHDPDTHEKKAIWNRAIDEAALSKLRFRVGDRLTVVSGERDGVSGTVEQLLLRHLHAYLIRPDNGDEPFQASDVQVKLREA